MGKYSIIMPCYNLETIVYKTIESVLDQSYKNFELIIIDDGSTDNTLEEIKSYQQLDSRLKVFSKENAGVSVARNIGIAKSKGDYILFLDGDDIIEPDLLEKADQVFNKTDVDMFSFGYKKAVYNLDKVIKSYSNKKYDKRVFTGNGFQKLFFSKRISQCMCSFIVKKKIITENLILFSENTKYGEDQEFQLRCNINCENIYYESKEYFIYVQRKGSAINKKIVRDNFDVFFRMRDYINQELEKHYKNYLCYVFVYHLREIKEKGADEKTVKILLDIDVVVKSYRLEATKHNILTGLFLIFYKLFYKKRIIKKYKLMV